MNDDLTARAETLAGRIEGMLPNLPSFICPNCGGVFFNSYQDAEGDRVYRCRTDRCGWKGPWPGDVSSTVADAAATLRALVEERKRLTDGIGKALSSMQTVQDVMDGKVCAKSYRREWDAVMFLRAALTPPPGGEVG